MTIEERERLLRLQQAELHGVMPETPIEHMSDGLSNQFKSEHYRLAVVGKEGFIFLTDKHTRECTCHGKGIDSIDELIALLQKAKALMQEGV